MFWGCTQAPGLLSPVNGITKLFRIVCIITEHSLRNGWTQAQWNIDVGSWCIRIYSSSNTRIAIARTIFPYACIHKLHTAFTQSHGHSPCTHECMHKVESYSASWSPVSNCLFRRLYMSLALAFCLTIKPIDWWLGLLVQHHASLDILYNSL